MKILYILASITILSGITACSNIDKTEPNVDNNAPQNHEINNETSNDKTSNDNTDDQNKTENNTSHSADDSNSTMSQEETIQKIAEQEVNSFSFDLPSKLPVDDGKHITGTTNSKEGYFEVTFYQSDEVIPPNDDTLKKDTDKIARLQIQEYDSEDEANKEISFEDFAEIGGEEIDLVYNLTGYQDAGAGSVFTSWNEGRWALATRASTQNSNDGVKLAKEAVSYLETHTLPAPQEYGKVQLDTEVDGSIVKWQKGNKVYTVDQVKKPLDTLKIAVAFE